MKSAVAGVVCVAVLACAAIVGIAQSTADPRVGLKAGLRDAGQAARNMELIASLPRPEGFFDPKMPAGRPTPPEAPRTPEPPPGQPEPENPAATAVNNAVANALSYSNSDLAFNGHQIFVGNFHGFNTYDIENARNPRLLASVVCPGGQGDVSVYGHLLFYSVEQTRGRVDCGTQGNQDAVSAERFRGVRIFDITDIKKPRQVAAIQTCRGSHTHTLVPAKGDTEKVMCTGRVSEHGPLGRRARRMFEPRPEEDPNTSLYSIDVIQVPLANPEQSRIVNRPRIFGDASGDNIAALWTGGDHGPGTQTTSSTNRCHDITVFPEIGLAAGACSGNGILLDISDPVHRSASTRWPTRTSRSGIPRRSTTTERRCSSPTSGAAARVITVPRIRSAKLGRRRHLDVVDRERPLRELLQDAGGADRHRERVAHQRHADPGARPRHHGSGVVPRRRVGIRLHRLGAPGRDCVLRSRAARTPSSSSRAATGYLLVTATSTVPRSPGDWTSSGSGRAGTHSSQNEIAAATLVQSTVFNAQLQSRDHVAGQLRSSRVPTSISSRGRRASVLGAATL